MNTLPPEPEPVPVPRPSAHERVTAAYERITEAARPELWTTLRPLEDALVDAKALDERVRAGETLPLSGVVFAVEGGVDSGLEAPATVVTRLAGAGAVLLGTTAADVVPSAWDRLKVAGSASAVTVALGIADLALGTSGPVPAALNAVVGLRPTAGLLPVTGVSGRVSVFARKLVVGQQALAVATGTDPADPCSRSWPADLRLGVGEHPRVAIPGEAGLAPLCPAARHAFGTVAAALRAAGAILEPVGATVDELATAKTLDGFAALLLPTVPEHPDLAKALADPDAVHRRLHTYRTDAPGLASVTVPVLPQDRRPFGVTVLTRPFEDQIGLDLAAVCLGEPVTPYPEPGTDVVVFGAHLRGQPLNARLAELGARFEAPAYTAERYRMVLLDTQPAQPGVVEDTAGTTLDGERWRLSPAALGRFTAELPEPLRLGRVELDDGTCPLAVVCTPEAAQESPDLVRYASWRGYLRFLSTAGRRDPG